MASIHAIASLHALVTLDLLDDPAGYAPGFTSLLLTLQRVPDVFEEAFRPYRFRVPRAADCLICQAAADSVLRGGTRCGPGSSAGATGRCMTSGRCTGSAPSRRPCTSATKKPA